MGTRMNVGAVHGSLTAEGLLLTGTSICEALRIDDRRSDTPQLPSSRSKDRSEIRVDALSALSVCSDATLLQLQIDRPRVLDVYLAHAVGDWARASFGRRVEDDGA